MANVQEPLCVICDKVLLPEDKCTVKQRAINSLIDASVQRRDRKDKILKTLTSAEIHKSCQTTYVRKTSIQVAAKTVTQSISTKRRQNSEARKFDFSSNCFFCGNNVSLKNNSSAVHFVKSDETRINILDEIDDRRVNG